MDQKIIEEKIQTAKKAALNAYAPYSKFRVGCVVETHAGNFYEGCNVENISYGLACCAERTAIFKAASTEGPSMKLKHVFVAMADHKEGAPCGACRQVIAEFDESTMVYFKLGGETKTMTVSQLLPCNFDKL